MWVSIERFAMDLGHARQVALHERYDPPGLLAAHGSIECPMPASSVILVSYRTPELTERAAGSALSQQGSAVEVIVVDNASGDDTLGRLHHLPDQRLRTAENDANLGFGAAANRGARMAHGDVLLFLNSDAELAPGVADALGAEVERHGGRAIVGPRLVGPDGTIQRSTGRVWGPLALGVRALGLHRLATALRGLPLVGGAVGQSALARSYDTAAAVDDPVDVNVVTGACFAVGRVAFWELGGFDERFFLYFEDTDLCRRAAAAGMRIRYLPQAVVTHIGGASSSEDYHFGPAHARSMRQYLGKWYGPGGAALAVLLLWLRAVAFSLTLRPAAGRSWRALWAALRPGDGPP